MGYSVLIEPVGIALRILIFSLSILFSVASGFASHAVAIADLQAKIVAQDVPEEAVSRLFHFLASYDGANYTTDTYACKGKSETDPKPCNERERIPGRTTVVLHRPAYAVIFDVSKSSTEKRLFLIDMASGQVKSFLAAHGLGSGNGLFPTRFSNRKDSRKTSLGYFLAGNTYSGVHGLTLRMYGLSKSNDQAYVRDIVMHGARYAKTEFTEKINRLTGLAYGRLGVSWGCPVLAPDQASHVIAALKGGGVIYHYHPEFAERVDNGAGGDMVSAGEAIPLPTLRTESLK